MPSETRPAISRRHDGQREPHSAGAERWRARAPVRPAESPSRIWSIARPVSHGIATVHDHRQRGERQRDQQPAPVRAQEAEQSPEGRHSDQSSCPVNDQPRAAAAARSRDSSSPAAAGTSGTPARSSTARTARSASRACSPPRRWWTQLSQSPAAGARGATATVVAKRWSTRYARFSRLPGVTLNSKTRAIGQPRHQPASGERREACSGRGVVRASVASTGRASSGVDVVAAEEQRLVGVQDLVGLFFGRAAAGSTATTWSASV